METTNKTWTYQMVDITKRPNMVREYGTKFIVMTQYGSFPCNTEAEALECVISKPDYRRRVNKPEIKFDYMKMEGLN